MFTNNDLLFNLKVIRKYSKIYLAMFMEISVVMYITVM